MLPKTLVSFCVFSLILFIAGCSQTPLPITVAVSPQSTAIATGQTLQFTATLTNDATGVSWSASVGTIDSAGNYTAPPGPQSAIATITATSKKDPTKSASASVKVVAPGVVSQTNNVQVALYTIAPPASGNVSVQFGATTAYGLTTWTQPIPQGGGAVSLFVAGMLANTPYHIRGVVQFADGTQFNDADLTFTTGSLPAAQLPSLTVTTTPGMTPQSGVESLDLVNTSGSNLYKVAFTDLNGNVLWAYDTVLAAGAAPEPIKLLPNGHVFVNFVFSSSVGLGLSSIAQEVDLGGNVTWQMTSAQLNQALASATCAGCNITILSMHHDIAILPDGHLIVLADTQQTINGTVVTGDVLIDLDQNRKPVWLWNEFDHLDTSRQPMGWPDWTHTNAVLYSSDDGNLIVSIRHQNWLVKVNYSNGAGDGSILWHLGYQGDFTLLNADGTPDPANTDWFFAQHGPSFVTTNTTGKFTLAIFDNGNDRFSATGLPCGGVGQPVCTYSTVPVLQLDETAKTATLALNPTTPASSFFGGNAEVLKNANLEYDNCAGGPGAAGDIYEVTQTNPPQTAWQMHSGAQYIYRGFRIPSLYPGVQW